MVNDLRGTDPKGKLRRITIEPAENGYSVSTDREPVPSVKKDADPDAVAPSAYQPPKSHVFNSAKDAHAHVGEQMGLDNC